MEKNNKYDQMVSSKLYFDPKIRELVRSKDPATLKLLGFTNIDDVEVVIVESPKNILHIPLPENAGLLNSEEFSQVNAGVDTGTSGTVATVGTGTTFSTWTSSVSSASTLGSVGSAGTAGCGG